MVQAQMGRESWPGPALVWLHRHRFGLVLRQLESLLHWVVLPVQIAQTMNLFYALHSRHYLIAHPLTAVQLAHHRRR